MKNHFEHFQAFIEEQKKWFEQHLSADFAQTWNDHIWVSGNQGSGWLRGNGRNTLRFDEMNRFKGIVEHLPIDKEYSQFMKAMLVVVYRQGNRSMSPAVAKATLMILKRWYHAMLYETGQTHPSYLSTVVIQRAMDLLSSVSSPSDPNTANYKGRCVSLQKLVNHFTFTLVKLQYNSDVKYTNKTNLTRKARETMALKQQAKLSDTTTDGEDALITIRGFLNIVALIQRVESDAEKIALNCLLLLVITGFRSIEAFNLRQDALFKRQIDDPAICKRFQDKGLPDYFLGIRYVGVKGAGERTHWVEPLAVPLVESIFSTVKMLTAPIRSHLTYLRAKSFADYLPQAISNMPGERVELDDVVKYITQTTSSFRGRAGQRDKTSKALSKRGVLPVQEIPGPKNSKSIYYSKTALNHYIKTEFGLANANEPCTHAWMENGKRYQVNYEDLLFLHEKGSLALKRTLALLATPIPFTNTLMNKFLGNVEPDGSVFSKYQLLEEDGTSTRMRTHIPRHNINTFLAIADISDHLQAMLMGRVDITQNQHYQHLALAERRKAASLVPLQPISTALTVSPSSSSIATPLDIVKRTGQNEVAAKKALSPAAILALEKEYANKKLAAYVFPGRNLSLTVDADPQAEISSKETLAENLTSLTLSNGARVILAKSAGEEQKLQIIAVSNKGDLSFPAQQKSLIALANKAVSGSGVGELSSSSLKRWSAENSVTMSSKVSGMNTLLSVSARTNNPEPGFQLINQRITHSTINDNIWASLQNAQIQALKTLDQRPAEKFAQQMYETRYADDRTKLLQENQIAQFTAADALAADRQLFSSPADITFVIVGNVAEDKLVVLITRYLGSIKHSDSPLAAGKPLTRATDNASVTVKEQNEPVAQVSQWKRYDSRTPVNLPTRMALDAFNVALAKDLRVNIREQASGAYSVSSRLSVDPQAKDISHLLAFTCQPERHDELLTLANEVMVKRLAKGISEQELNEYQQNVQRSLDIQQRSVQQLANTIVNSLIQYDDPAAWTEQEQLLKQMTVENVNTAVKQYLSHPVNTYTGVLLPK